MATPYSAMGEDSRLNTPASSWSSTTFRLPAWLSRTPRESGSTRATPVTVQASASIVFGQVDSEELSGAAVAAKDNQKQRLSAAPERVAPGDVAAKLFWSWKNLCACIVSQKIGVRKVNECKYIYVCMCVCVCVCVYIYIYIYIKMNILFEYTLLREKFNKDSKKKGLFLNQ